MTGKHGKGKKKKSVVLDARNVEMVDGDEKCPSSLQRKVVVKKKAAPSKKIIRGSTLSSKADQTINVDVPDDTESNAPAPETSSAPEKAPPPAEPESPPDTEPPVPNVAKLPVGKPVDLNDPSVRDRVEQRPLDPSQTQKTPQPEPPREVLGEPMFKFFCYRCGQKLMVPVSWANKSYPCGRCGHDIVIPPPLIGNIW